MTSRDNGLWLKFWRDDRTDFHQPSINPFLIRFWPKLNTAPGSRVFVPLCGKSLDMLWLAQQGHEVVGVELSPIAVKAFFRENRLKPSRHKVGHFTLWRHGKISILCGDYFSLRKTDLGPIDLVYDRAALTALPEDIRHSYVAQLERVVPKSAQVLLLTIEDAEEEDEPLCQTMGIDTEIKGLYSENFAIELAHVESLLEQETDSPDQSLTHAAYKVYRLIAKPGT